jgi:hypothetical protein
MGCLSSKEKKQEDVNNPEPSKVKTGANPQSGIQNYS